MFDKPSSHLDAVVVGAGPAGLAIAAALAGHGLDVACLAPRARAPWEACYGAFAAELDGTPAATCGERIWRRPYVQIDHRSRIDVPFAYVRVDPPALQQLLVDRLTAAGGALVDARVTQITPSADGAELSVQGGRDLRCRLVVDASGATSPFTARRGHRPPAFQSAYGERVELSHDHDLAPDAMALMDFRGDEPGPPTFLYAMPLGRRELFVEETVLVGRPPTPHQVLRGRLHRRLARMGLRVARVKARELCLIPMGGPLPLRSQAIVAFGAAAGMVHPATGYQLARALRLARPTAAAIAEGLASSPAQAARNAYATVWPEGQLRAWELYRFGMEVLADLDLAGIRRFMHAFFQLSPHAWFGFMTGTATPREVVASMWQVFGHADFELRGALLRMGAGRGSHSLLRAALPNNPL